MAVFFEYFFPWSQFRFTRCISLQARSAKPHERYVLHTRIESHSIAIDEQPRRTIRARKRIRFKVLLAVPGAQYTLHFNGAIPWIPST